MITMSSYIEVELGLANRKIHLTGISKSSPHNKTLYNSQYSPVTSYWW